MGIEEFPQVGIQDPTKLKKIIESNDPQSVLGQFGFGTDDINRMMQGDLSPIHDRMKRKQMVVIDFNKVMDTKLVILSKDLCSSFFVRSKSAQDFTPEEVEMYGDTYRRMFNGFFNTCDDHVFIYEKVPDARNLLVKFQNETYQMSIVGDEAVILYVGDETK
jgi:hypothetical protein